jgi:hypothetical protein
MLHLPECRLEADDGRISLRPIANPDAHEAMQVTRADAAASGDIFHSQTAMLLLDLTERPGDDSMNAGVLESSEEKAFELVDALRG